MALSITPAGPFIIPIGTLNYSQPITIVDSTTNTDVTIEGLWEGFYMDWDQSTGTLTILSAEVTRLVGEYVWLVKAVEGMTTVTAEIVYSVVPNGPIITPITDTVVFYRDTPANLDILIRNTPDEASVEGLQVGMKYDSGETFEGVKIAGMLPTGAKLTETTFTPQVTAENFAARVTSDLNCAILPGSPPEIGTVDFTPNGSYGEIEFTDVTNAFGYEWTLAAGDLDSLPPEMLHYSDSTRGTIDPKSIEVTPGNLNVTVAFKMVPGASFYEYMLESESHNVSWTRFKGGTQTLATIIIPDLQDGVQYTLRLRVASPWVGAPVSVTVYGGRLAFVMHEDGSDSYLYIFHTGVPDGGTATRIKRLLLPTTFTGPDRGGIAIDGDDAYIINVESTGEDKALYKFDWTAFDDGDRVNNARRNPFGSGIFDGASSKGMGIRGDELYINISNSNIQPWDAALHVIDKDQTDGATLTPKRSTNGGPSMENESGLSLSNTTLFLMDTQADFNFYPADFSDGDTISSSQDLGLPGITTSNLKGLSVIGEGEQVYIVTSANDLLRFETDGTNYVEVWRVHLPTGLTDPYRVDIAT